ncbi:MAG: Uma2 family endonuclease [Pyrinomonadaceae bacterium]|jgi:Uma2 family endonuclease|nr:Uma2 family endonuclease [Pyrinomonadaceae bacterium]
MAQIISPIPQEIGPPFTVNFKSIRLTATQFEQLCSDNRDLRLELTFEGELIVMPPTGSKTGLRNARLNLRLGNWAEIDGTGICFDSSTGFTLPNGAKYSPDSAWIRRDRWDAVTTEEQEGFAPLCPDFLIELRSHSDRLSRLQNKLQEYIENGAHLAWLIDPLKRQVYIYRPDHAVEVLDDPVTVSGDPVLRGFVLNPLELW